MKIAGIIAEYNPFHNGHREHIEQTRSIHGAHRATHIVVVMSGNFTQRGDVSILPKHIRAEAALRNGADLIIELPVSFSLSSAEQFAKGAVTLLNALGCVDSLSFGSECGNIELLKKAGGAVKHAQNTADFFDAMRNGMSYPAALQSAVERHYDAETVAVLSHPNNTLAVEYIKELSQSKSLIEPFTIQRVGAAHDEIISEYGDFGNVGSIVSASQIRKMMFDSRLNGILNITNLANLTPMQFSENNCDFADVMRLETAILAKLRTMSVSEIRKAPNVRDGLEHRIHNAAKTATGLTELHMLVKTKRYTLAHIRRAMLCCFLGVTGDDVEVGPQYIRILGMNARGKEILTIARKNCTLPMESSLAALIRTAKNKHSTDIARQALLENRCTNIYALAFEKKQVCNQEFTNKTIVM